MDELEKKFFEEVQREAYQIWKRREALHLGGTDRTDWAEAEFVVKLRYMTPPSISRIKNYFL